MMAYRNSFSNFSRNLPVANDSSSVSVASQPVLPKLLIGTRNSSEYQKQQTIKVRNHNEKAYLRKSQQYHQRKLQVRDGGNQTTNEQF